MKILILRLSSMGDILLATPVLDVLKNRFPDSEIDWAVYKKFEESIKLNPNISTIISFDKNECLKNIRDQIRSSGYDLVFDLHKNSKTYFLTRNLKNVFRYNKRVIERLLLVLFKRKYKRIIPATKMYFAALNHAGIETPEKWQLSFYPDMKVESLTISNYALKSEPYAVIVPGASYFTKIWPKECFKELSEKLLAEKRFRKIIVVGKGEIEEEAGNFICAANKDKLINLTGRLNLSETAVIIKYADIVITNDNGPMHLAECFNRKIIAIFGCTTEEFGFFPYSTEYKVIENKKLKCRPCTHFGRKKCPQGHFKCMKEITPELVYNEIADFIK